MKLTAEPQAPDIQLTPDYNSPNKSCLTWCMAFLFAKNSQNLLVISKVQR